MTLLPAPAPPAGEPALHPPILLSPPDLTGAEFRGVIEALASNWVAPVGPLLDRFEAGLAASTGFRHAVATSSCTAALHLGCRLLGVGRGDEVWAPTLTFIASVAPALQQGATPVFLDVDPATWTLDAGLLEAALAEAAHKGRLPKLVIPTDLYGHPADLAAILAVCGRWGVAVLSDGAASLGARAHGAHAGTGAAACCVSFNGNKIVTTGGGGALLTDDTALATTARHLATQAREDEAHYEHRTWGYNYALSNVLAGIGVAQLPDLARRVARRRAIFARYRDALGSLPGVAAQEEAPWARSNRWLTAITVDPHHFGATAEAIRLALAADGIETRPVWKPMHLQPAFASVRAVGGGVAEDLFARGLCLPSGSGLSPAAQDRVIAAIAALHRRVE
ncbi:DegT/DnrJ/EryC1/StrS family aminotransferase [Elioraea sp.]|uniref:DegT/DnrJ/EryC1/StrS family aminotransferase n=1 Tax=Elioraea sp. TaxID=2185103 RepID=UPI003F705BA1